MKKEILILICIGIIAIIGISTISAAENNSTKLEEININNVSFEIPPEFQGGTLKESSYQLGTMFDFGILSLKNNKNLVNNYGYESTLESVYDVEELNIGSHSAVAFYSNRSFSNHTITHLYFESDGIIFQLSYNGNDVNDTIKKIVLSSPEPKLSQSEFNEKLNTAQEDYIEKEKEANEYYAYEQGYNNGYSQGSKDNRHNDYFGYYLSYKLGQRSR